MPMPMKEKSLKPVVCTGLACLPLNSLGMYHSNLYTDEAEGKTVPDVTLTSSMPTSSAIAALTPQVAPTKEVEPLSVED